MESFKFIYNDKEYELGEDNFSDFIKNEDHPISGIERSDIIELLRQQEVVDFNEEYYDKPCQVCLTGKKEKEQFFKFLEYHFYIFTKEGKYVTSNISKNYIDMPYKILLKKGKVDNSHIVSIIVCIHCGDYTIEIDQCDI